MATVYKRGSTWWIRYQWRGQKVRRSAHTSTKSVAQQYLAELQAENQRLDRGGKPRRTFKEAYARFLVDYLPMLKPRTQERYLTTLRIVAGTFGDLYLDEITRGRLADFATKRLRGGVVAPTIRRDLATMSVMCSCAVAWDWIDVNPVKSFSKRHLKESRPRSTYPSVEDVDRLVAKASPMAGRIIRFLASTGMRQEEVCGLEWSQVSLQRREVRLTKTKTSSPRVVPLSDMALDTLVGTPRHITSPFVFWHHDGARFNNFAGYFRGIAKRAQFPFRCHDLRHHFASTFAQRVGDIAALQAILGHKTVAMTMRYSHMITGHLHAAMAKYGANRGTTADTTASVSVSDPVIDGSPAGPYIETSIPA